MRRLVAILTACAVLALASAHAAAADTITGTWTIAANTSTAGSVRFDLRSDHSDARGHHDDEFGQTVTLASLGLSQTRLSAQGGHIVFSIHRDAGDIVCDGRLGQGSGSGKFAFTPSASYATALQSRGAGDITDRGQLSAAVLDVSLAYADGIDKAGFGQVRFHDLIPMRALDVTPEYISAMRSAGTIFSAPRETVEARALRVDPGYVREMAGAGYPNLTLRELVELRAMNIDAAYVRKVASHGFHDLTIQKLVQVKAMDVI